MGDISQTPHTPSGTPRATHPLWGIDSPRLTHLGDAVHTVQVGVSAILLQGTSTNAYSSPAFRSSVYAVVTHNKAIVAIARKLLVTVWLVHSKQVADRQADPVIVARKQLQHAYHIG